MHSVRLLLATVVCAASFIPAVCRSPVLAQSPAASAPLPCSGTVNIVRVSEIKPGMMSKFLDAVAAQKAWYKKAGAADQVTVMRVMRQDTATKKYQMSEDQAITTHIIATGRTNLPHDADWDQFVKMFADTSTIKDTYMTCMDTM